MKTGKSSISFGFSTVNAGQRVVSTEPNLIATSTEGGFRITPVVSSALGLSHGEYIMFINNVVNIDQAILNNAPEVLAFCEEQGLEVGTPETAVAIHNEFDMWAIAKGIKERDTKGNYKTTTERLLKKDKVAFVSQNFDEYLAQFIENGDEETKAALTREGVTKEEQIEILTTFVKPKELDKYKGSKLANTGGISGPGTALTFTDSNVWKQLKADMGDTATDFNRVYDLDLTEIQTIPIHDGYAVVEVKALVLGESVDKEPARIGSKEAKEEAGEAVDEAAE